MKVSIRPGVLAYGRDALQQMQLEVWQGRHGVTAMDLAAIAGLDPWDDEYDVMQLATAWDGNAQGSPVVIAWDAVAIIDPLLL